MSNSSKQNEPKFMFMSRKEDAIHIDLNEDVEKFLYTKRVEKRTPKTIQTYRQVLEQFAKWYTDSEHSIITTDVMREYIYYLSYEKERWDDHPTSPTGVKGLTPRTVNNVTRNLKIFFNHLIRERRIKNSPMDSLGYQVEDKNTFEVFTDDHVIKLLEAPNRRTYTGLRDYAMMLVLCDTGLRIKELTNLKLSDVDLKRNQIIVNAEIAKSRTMRVAPISKLTAREIERLIAYMNLEDPNDYLWLTQFGERYFADTFSKMLKKYGKKAGITEARCSPHTFRHFFAVKFLRNGGDPIALMRILGHTSMSMTEKYVKYTKTDLSEQHLEASPVMSLIDKGNERKRGKVRF
ncbi:tyrosine-type recombinase/integrase [Paenibacillus alvei]|uniref:Tyrosine-type recombinase/integrase n=1 Tax=Paenibacillus alvei TaxID=44250 RepID=A0ABT4EGX6_PAEAL|nr:tyrosine-type recombinase/integrase [Paenibacillus alvei]MCY9532999.1 tyrosine-type recombinase/integrase [Paenibacillus alvei]